METLWWDNSWGEATEDRLRLSAVRIDGETPAEALKWVRAAARLGLLPGGKEEGALPTSKPKGPRALRRGRTRQRMGTAQVQNNQPVHFTWAIHRAHPRNSGEGMGRRAERRSSSSGSGGLGCRVPQGAGNLAAISLTFFSYADLFVTYLPDHARRIGDRTTGTARLRSEAGRRQSRDGRAGTGAQPGRRRGSGGRRRTSGWAGRWPGPSHSGCRGALARQSTPA